MWVDREQIREIQDYLVERLDNLDEEMNRINNQLENIDDEDFDYNFDCTKEEVVNDLEKSLARNVAECSRVLSLRDSIFLDDDE